MQAGTYFPKVRRMLLFLAPLNLIHICPASTLLHCTLLLPLCLLLRSLLKFWSVGFTDEVHLGESFRAKDFGLECLRDVQRLSWILHIGSVSACLSSSVQSMKTSAAPYPGIRNPIVVYLMSRKQRVSPFYRIAHTSSTLLLHFCYHSFWTFCLAVRQPGDAHKSTFPQICNHSWTRRTSILEDAIFHRMNWCKFLWGNPCRAIETFNDWESCLWDFWFSMHFLSFCCMKELGEGFGCVNFARLWISWRKLQLSPLEHCPLVFHCQQSPRVLCPRCFVPWFLTTAFLS